MKFPHRVLEGAEEEAVINNVMAMIPTLNKAGTKERWETGWGEILEAYKRTGDIASLRPQYIRPNQPVRLNGKFVMPEDPDIEAKWYAEFFAGIADKWLKGHRSIWEFGAGSCHNVATLACMYPDSLIVGMDWARPTALIIEELIRRGHRVASTYFDFFEPRPLFLAGGAIFTVGALEQTGKHWMPFLECLLKSRPAICIHIEPQLDWYEIGNPVDRTAIAAHKERGFWEGFYEELRRRRGMGGVEILHTERTGFGSLFCEGYSQLIWRPR